VRWTWPARGKYDWHPCLSYFQRPRATVGRATPDTLALSVGLALVLGVFPVYGCPTLLCAAAAIVLRLNLPAMQLVNALTTPLQLALWIPFHRLGDLLLRGAAGTQVGTGAAAGVHSEAWQFLGSIWTLAAHAVAGWFCVCAPLAILLLYLSTESTWRTHSCVQRSHSCERASILD